jgi:hypothetical protein
MPTTVSPGESKTLYPEDADFCEKDTSPLGRSGISWASAACSGGEAEAEIHTGYAADGSAQAGRGVEVVIDGDPSGDLAISIDLGYQIALRAIGGAVATAKVATFAKPAPATLEDEQFVNVLETYEAEYVQREERVVDDTLTGVNETIYDPKDNDTYHIGVAVFTSGAAINLLGLVPSAYSYADARQDQYVSVGGRDLGVHFDEIRLSL